MIERVIERKREREGVGYRERGGESGRTREAKK